MSLSKRKTHSLIRRPNVIGVILLLFFQGQKLTYSRVMRLLLLFGRAVVEGQETGRGGWSAEHCWLSIPSREAYSCLREWQAFYHTRASDRSVHL
jgi:hypothetical protein